MFKCKVYFSSPLTLVRGGTPVMFEKGGGQPAKNKVYMSNPETFGFLTFPLVFWAFFGQCYVLLFILGWLIDIQWTSIISKPGYLKCLHYLEL